MERADRLEDIAKTYAEFERDMEERGISFGETNNGYWVPISFPEAIIFADYIKRLIKEEQNKKNNGNLKLGPIVDAGSGDGRMLAILEAFGFKPIIGIESDRKLYDASVYLIEDLIQRRIINDGVVSIIHGDYTETETYKKAGLSFKQVPYFYTGINSASLTQLARRMIKKSPDETKLFVFGPFFEEKDLPKIPLNLERRLGLNHRLTHKLVENFFMHPLGELVVYKK